MQSLLVVVMVAFVSIGVMIAVRSGQSGARKVMFSIATVLVAVAIPIAGTILSYLDESPAGVASNTGAESSPSSSQTRGKSPSYQAGYTSGSAGWAKEYFERFGGFGGRLGTDATERLRKDSCNQAFAIAQVQTPSLDTDFTQGCLNALHGNPP
jgi:hypothetical protein